MPTFDKIIAHIRDREYMSGIDRDQTRVKATSEVFTPTELVWECLDNLDQNIFKDLESTIIDRSCGDGQFLGETLIRKIENGIDFETALSTIYGVDLMPDNVKLCQDRLLCGQEHLRHIVEKNIVCHNALDYDYSFNGTNFTEKELREQQQFGSKLLPAPKSKKTKKNKLTPINIFD
jgi:hypothetical protein